MKRKPKVSFAYAAVDKRGRVNPYWVRATAATIREQWPEKRAKKLGYRIKKIKLELVHPL